MATVCYVWEFMVKPEYIKAFETTYGQTGEWVRLFQCDSAFIRSELLRDREQPGRYLTLDYWKTRKSYMSFRERFREEYKNIIDQCQQYTLSERQVGDFDQIA